MSSTSSRVTEDWDVETSAHEQRITNIAAWVEEAGPSTPTRRVVSSGSAAENWDDDFEDRLDSPRRSERKSPTAFRMRTTTSTTTATENWDDEFQFGDSPAKSKHAQYLHAEQDEDSEDDYPDFNALDKDEDDRTVTARSRKGGLAKLVFDSAPAVPPLPLSAHHSDFSAHVDQPFPRSPTTSSRDRDSIAAPSYYSYNSTTHLRGLGNLPPSPPIHKERERRRLRKKSRPQAPQGLEAMNFSAESVVGDEGGGRSRPVTPLQSRSSLRSTSLERNKRDSMLSSHTNTTALPSSPPPKTPLLSRIGSVKKKWPVRKKRASSTPSEVEMQRGEESSKTNWFFLPTSANASASSSASSSKVDEHSQVFSEKEDTHQTPKASRTNNSSHHTIPDVPPLLPPFNARTDDDYSRSNATPIGIPTTPSTPSKLMKRKSFGFVQLKSRNKPMNELNHVQENPSPSPYSPTSHPPHIPPRHPNRPNPKRHSVSANLSSMESTSTSDLPSDLEAELHGNASASGSNASCNASMSSSSVDLNSGNRESILRPSQSRHGSYGGLGLGRAPQGSSDNIEGSRRRSFSKSSRKRSKSRDKRNTTSSNHHTTGSDAVKHAQSELDQDKEPGGRGFMGSVRRISFIGKQKQEGKEHRHKRTKSGVSLASIGDGFRKSFERGRMEDGNADIGDGEERIVNSAPPIPPLLPPIELSPPSPPRVGDASPSFALASASAAQSTFSKPAALGSSPRSTKPVSPKAVSPLTASLGRSTGVPSIGRGGKSITSSTSMPAASVSANVPRRNSLGDLKIPARISQAQVGLRRDLGMVKEFAGRVEQLKNLQTTYHNLLVEVQSVLDAQHAQYAVQAQSHSRGTSPSLSASSPLASSSPSSPSAMNPMNIFRPLSRIRSNTSSTVLSPSSSSDSAPSPLATTSHMSPTAFIAHPENSQPSSPPANTMSTVPEVSMTSLQSSFPHPDTYKHLAAAFYTINSRYKIAWECAELLIELGGGPPSATDEGNGGTSEFVHNTDGTNPSGAGGAALYGRPPTSTSAPTALGSVGSSQAKKSRERAITLSGDESSSSKPGTPIPGAGPSAYFLPSSGSNPGSMSMTAQTSATSTSAPGSAPNMAWRASTGRHDLNQRQLLLLREMLNNSDSTFVHEGVPPNQQLLQSQPLPSALQRTQSDEHHFTRHPNPIIHSYSQHSSRGQRRQNSPMNSPLLTTPPTLPHASEEVNREWRWGHGVNSSTITLPSEESSVPSGSGLDRLGAGEPSQDSNDPRTMKKNRKTSRSSRLRGMSGLRDMLRSLTRNQNHQSTMINTSIMMPSTTSLGTEESSVEYHHRYIHGKVAGTVGGSSTHATHGRRRAKTSSGPDAGSSIRDRDQERSTSPYPNTHARPTSPYTASSFSAKASPRRPSLASIFRLGNRESKEGKEAKENKEKLNSSPSFTNVQDGVNDVIHTKESSGKTSGTSDEDWDRLELEYPQRRQDKKGHTPDPSPETIRGRSPYMQDVALPPVPPIPSSASQTSLPLGSPGPNGIPGVPARATRLSNVEENEHVESGADDPRASMTSLSNRRTSPAPYRKEQKNLTGSVRSMPAQPLSVDHASHSKYHLRHSYASHNAQLPSHDHPNASHQMKLAMTPENIKPLLENAKEVHARLTDCIGEIKGLVFALGEGGLGSAG
ncbi:hypothetical protein F5878DRAFT_402697 [Lentinula raphanica]|uniref:Uncharacterized protein n=1 Tax=Lentinula raphanica TaxID=153919 RepID=A0AA38PG90_9AGAR|nr:hypothetical protein F5878DRAFT_402697 [Lentinula raphanica]